MKCLPWKLCFLFVSSVFVTAEIREIKISSGEVVFVNVLLRHGARAPDKTYKNDPYKDAFPDGIGELTNRGKAQAYELGEWLRKRYHSLLTDTYSPDLLYVMSSDTDRVLMSAEACLAGLYPPRGRQIWKEDLDWQPIPVHTVPKDMDKILAMKAPCPAYDKELKKVLASKEVQTLNEKYKYIVDILDKNTGENRSDFKYIANIYDTLKVQNECNLELPKWTKGIFPQPMEEAALLRFSLPTWNTRLARLRTGPLLQELIKNMERKVANRTGRVMHLYAGHDTTITNLLQPLGVWDQTLPSYSACVLLELLRGRNGAYKVELFYCNSTSAQPVPLEIPGCLDDCTLETFTAITKPLIPEDWNKECNQIND